MTMKQKTAESVLQMTPNETNWTFLLWISVDFPAQSVHSSWFQRPGIDEKNQRVLGEGKADCGCNDNIEDVHTNSKTRFCLTLWAGSLTQCYCIYVPVFCSLRAYIFIFASI